MCMPVSDPVGGCRPLLAGPTGGSCRPHTLHCTRVGRSVRRPTPVGCDRFNGASPSPVSGPTLSTVRPAPPKCQREICSASLGLARCRRYRDRCMEAHRGRTLQRRLQRCEHDLRPASRVHGPKRSHPRDGQSATAFGTPQPLFVVGAPVTYCPLRMTLVTVPVTARQGQRAPRRCPRRCGERLQAAGRRANAPLASNLHSHPSAHRSGCRSRPGSVRASALHPAQQVGDSVALDRLVVVVQVSALPPPVSLAPFRIDTRCARGIYFESVPLT
jgi:hypothetical protein